MRASTNNHRHTDITSSDSEAPAESIIQALRAENKRLRDLVCHAAMCTATQAVHAGNGARGRHPELVWLPVQVPPARQ